MNLFLDIETNTDKSKIWMCYTFDEENQFLCHTNPDTLIPLINKADKVVGHNLIGFDGPILNRLWKTNIGLKNSMDTLVMSRLLNPSLEGGHSLEAWGNRLKKKKSDYQRIYWRLRGVRKFDKTSMNHWNEPNIPLMSAYCKRDVEVLVQLYKHLVDELTDFSQESVDLEHRVAAIVQKQIENGFTFDIPKAQVLLAELSGKVADIEAHFQEVFPPIIHERWSEKTGKRLKDRVEVFNPASRQQIAARLESLGVKFKTKTDKGNVVVDEKTLATIDKPEAKLLNEYLLLQKRVSQIKSWFEQVKDDGRIHGRVITNGAVTGRMTHQSPNMAQIPSVGSEYGAECRDCFIARSGWSLVGADASGLELRMLAHYMKDEGYVKTVVEGSSKDGTDVHTINQHAAGLSTRDQAKTFIYAFLYGAGPAKIGSIVGGDARTGQTLIERFLAATPSLQALRDKVAFYAEKGYVPGLDGRKVWVRSEHAALNTLLQSAGAIVMKKALCILHLNLRRERVPAYFCANVHDEWQIETPPQYADAVGKLAVESIKLAGEHFNMRCPLSGEYKIGSSWKDTH